LCDERICSLLLRDVDWRDRADWFPVCLPEKLDIAFILLFRFAPTSHWLVAKFDVTFEACCIVLLPKETVFGL